MSNVDALNEAMECDHVIAVLADGTVLDDLRRLHPDMPIPYAPSVLWIDGHAHIDGSGWEFASAGYTGQFGARPNDPVMHASECIGGRLAADILANPGFYAWTAVEDPDDPDARDAVGWVVVRQDLPGVLAQETALTKRG